MFVFLILRKCQVIIELRIVNIFMAKLSERDESLNEKDKLYISKNGGQLKVKSNLNNVDV